MSMPVPVQTCEQCGAPFRAFAAQIIEQGGAYCSPACRAAFAARPVLDERVADITDGRAVRPVSARGLPTGAQRGPSKQERQILAVIVDGGYPVPVTEYRFAQDIGRQYRLDFAWPDILAGIEYEGGIYGGGWHQTPEGMTDDCEKGNLATALGWRVFRITAPMLKSKPTKLTRSLGYWLDVIHGRVEMRPQR